MTETPGASVTITINENLPTTSGTMTENETWTGDVTLTGDVTVPAGVTLTIDPGARVLFSALSDDQGTGNNVDRAELIIEGSLNAVGTDLSGISFTSSSTTPATGDWHGIRVVTTGTSETVTMAYCTVSYGDLGIDVRADGPGATAAVSITHCMVQDTLGTGIFVYGMNNGGQVTVTVNDNIVSNNTGNGIYVYANGSASSVTGTVNGNQISNSGGYGMICYAYNSATSNITIDGNQVSSSDDVGIHVRTYNGSQGNVAVTNNTVTDSGQDTGSTVRYGIYVYTDTANSNADVEYYGQHGDGKRHLRDLCLYVHQCHGGHRY